MARSFLPTAAASLDISDPTDFNSTSLPGLAALDATLRCEICKDFYDAPVITSCGHTFCSLCIRRCLGADGKCATCRASEQESRLKRNPALAQAVEAYQAVRGGVLKAVSKKEEPKADVEEVQSTPRIGDGDGDGGFGPEEEMEDETDTPMASQRSTRCRTSTRSSTRGGGTKRKSTRKRGGGDDDDYCGDDDVQVISDSETPTSTPRRAPRRAAAPPDDGLVPCPVCSTRLTQAQVEAQIENCLAGKPHITPPSAPASPRKPFTFGQRTILSQTATSSSSASPKFSPRKPASTLPPHPSSSNAAPGDPELQPLPKLTYSMLSEKALRQKLQALGIRSDGPKKLLQERHTEWLNIWNANVDSPHPKKRRALIADLEEWERAHNRPPNRAAPGPVGKGYTKDWDDEKYTKDHKEEFDDLISKARESAKRRKLETDEAKRKADGEEREKRMVDGEEQQGVEMMEPSQEQKRLGEGQGLIPHPPSVSLSQPPPQLSKRSSSPAPHPPPSTAPAAPSPNPMPRSGNYKPSHYGHLPSTAPQARSPIVPIPRLQHHYAAPLTAPAPPKPIPHFGNPYSIPPPPALASAFNLPSHPPPSSSTLAPSSLPILHSDPGPQPQPPQTPPRPAKRKFDTIHGTPPYGDDEDLQKIDLKGGFLSHDEDSQDYFALC